MFFSFVKNVVLCYNTFAGCVKLLYKAYYRLVSHRPHDLHIQLGRFARPI